MLLSAPGWAATIMVFGDSLSAGYGLRPGEGWVDLLRQALPAHQVVNASQSGETTAGGLSPAGGAGAAQARYRHSGAGRQRRPARVCRRMICAPIWSRWWPCRHKARPRAAGGHGAAANYGQAYGRAFQMVYSRLGQTAKSCRLCRYWWKALPPTARGFRRMVFIPTPARRGRCGTVC